MCTHLITYHGYEKISDNEKRKLVEICIKCKKKIWEQY